MRGTNSGSGLDQTVRFRASDSTTDFLDDITEAWGLNSRSDAIRIIIHSWAGLLNGNFWAVTDDEKLADEWGDVGYLLSSAYASDEEMPGSLQEACLLDVMEDIPILLGAAESELGLKPPEADFGGDTNSMPSRQDRE